MQSSRNKADVIQQVEAPEPEQQQQDGDRLGTRQAAGQQWAACCKRLFATSPGLISTRTAAGAAAARAELGVVAVASPVALLH
jgi:hypothetical protein